MAKKLMISVSYHWLSGKCRPNQGVGWREGTAVKDTCCYGEYSHLIPNISKVSHNLLQLQYQGL